jgi:predicted enzyme related to lactoylglutathione lyase
MTFRDLIRTRCRDCCVAFAATVIAVASVALPGAADAGEGGLIVSPISTTPSGEIHNGKLVWVDLITTDPEKAVQFYSTVFGWQATYFSDEKYIELSRDGRPICSVVLFEDEEAQDGDARWLVSVSVDDVDEASQRAVDSGGSLLESPTDLPDRGRYSVVSDSQGAILMLLRATGGDSGDDLIVVDEWAWAELWTDDPNEAETFYKSLVGYDSLRFPDESGGELILLGSDGKARATIVSLPWDDVEPNWIPYIPVANVADTLKRIEDAGGATLLKSDDSDGTVAAAALVVDPTGGVFAIQQIETDQ